MPNALMLAFTNISDPDREDEFNDWYDEVHAVGALEIDGVISCRRYKLSNEQMLPPELPQFLAVYEVDPGAVDSLPKELANKFAAGEISMNELMSGGTMAFYTLISEPTV